MTNPKELFAEGLSMIHGIALRMGAADLEFTQDALDKALQCLPILYGTDKRARAYGDLIESVILYLGTMREIKKAGLDPDPSRN